MSNQDRYFYEKEGDAWFERNKGVLAKGGKIEQTAALLNLLDDPTTLTRVLDLGCANGWRLHELQKQFGVGSARCVGVDASAEAIQDGLRRYPDLELMRGVLADVPLKEVFDLVIVNFVLHWVDRTSIARSVSEVDRLVQDDGLLILGDFLPDFPQRRPYHHAKDAPIFTYKQDYAAIFEALGTYRELARMTFHHDVPGADLRSADSSARGVCVLLKKSLAGYYHQNG
ncbi:hypothetical protein D3C72_59340 [compost metagenome]